MTANSDASRRLVRFSWMESLGFIDSPTATWTTSPVAPSETSFDSTQTTELVALPVGRHTKRIEPTGELVRDMWDSTELHAPSLVDWAPQAFSSKTLGRREFRWPTLILAVVAVITLTGLGFWLYQRAGGTTAVAVAEVRSEADALAQAFRVATPLIDGLAAERLPQGNLDSTAFFEIDRAARAVFEASADLPPSAAADRSAAADAAGTALDASRQLMDATAYRTALEPALTLPLFETDPALADLTVATAAFTEWRASFENVYEGLPAISGQASAALEEVSNGLETAQTAYLDALRTGDSHAAVETIGVLKAQLQAVRNALLADMGEISTAVSGLLEDAKDRLDQLLG